MSFVLKIGGTGEGVGGTGGGGWRNRGRGLAEPGEGVGGTGGGGTKTIIDFPKFSGTKEATKAVIDFPGFCRTGAKKTVIDFSRFCRARAKETIIDFPGFCGTQKQGFSKSSLNKKEKRSLGEKVISIKEAGSKVEDTPSFLKPL